MIEASLLPKVMDQVASHARDYSDQLASHLRRTFPDVHFSICSDDDIPSRIQHVAANDFCRLYYVNSGGHCLNLTNDSEQASGIVVALCEGDVE
ncbi:DUF6129 family protein [Propionivibrio limicola]|uniref:DUF6129 family protein n=1 Tax=Propionivibrio limicola TaxID=167645 RepID=UPI001291469A|nr:DUF6129 family protein [Propionivibrio limicola]